LPIGKTRNMVTALEHRRLFPILQAAHINPVAPLGAIAVAVFARSASVYALSLCASGMDAENGRIFLMSRGKLAVSCAAA
jgi:hypothetical protein